MNNGYITLLACIQYFVSVYFTVWSAMTFICSSCSDRISKLAYYAIAEQTRYSLIIIFFFFSWSFFCLKIICPPSLISRTTVSIVGSYSAQTVWPSPLRVGRGGERCPSVMSAIHCWSTSQHLTLAKKRRTTRSRATPVVEIEPVEFLL